MHTIMAKTTMTSLKGAGILGKCHLSIPVIDSETLFFQKQLVNCVCVACICTYMQSQAHGRILHKLSKKLKVSSRKYPGMSGFSPLRSSSPVLYTSQTPPRCPSNHFHSGSDESDWSPANHTSSHGTYMYICMHVFLPPFPPI